VIRRIVLPKRTREPSTFSVDRLGAELQQPRTKELLRVAAIPALHLDALPCIVDHGGAGEGLGAAGPGLARCSRALRKAATRLATRRLHGLANCADAIFSCVQEKPHDHACIAARAAGRCARELTATSKGEVAFRAALASKCGGVDFFAGLRAAAGANLGALDADCDAVGVRPLVTLDDYATCVLRRHACAVEEALQLEAPRAEDLLALVGRSAPEFCPTPSETASPTPPATASQTPTAAPTP